MSDDMLDQRTRHRLEDLQDIVKQDAKLIQNLRREIEKLRARSVLIPESIQKIIDDYPAVCAERDRMRDALKPFKWPASAKYDAIHGEEPDDKIIGVMLKIGDMRAARDAIKGVTEPASPWRDIETAPKDGTPVEGSEMYRYLPYKPEGRRQMKADGRWQRWNGYGWENSEPPHGWKPLQEPPR